jgi:NAD(P)-dependent dehydrogenase (short-subunit alcohol dehydrogenase family)
MKILIIGGHGTIGKRVVDRFQKDHDVIVGGRSKGDVLIDIADSNSLSDTLGSIGKLDAIVCIAGEAKWDVFDNLTEDDFYIGIRSKLMGQVNLVRIGKDHLNSGGSITLSTGILADDPVPFTTSAAMVNGAVNSFVKSLKLDLTDEIRVNVVSLGLVEDSYEKYKDYFPGHTPISMEQAVDAYVRSVEGNENGEIIKIYQ